MGAKRRSGSDGDAAEPRTVSTIDDAAWSALGRRAERANPGGHAAIQRHVQQDQARRAGEGGRN